MPFDLTVYIFALLVGILLGLIGGVASLLTIPIFVYICGFSASLATTYSLFVIGITSAIRLFAYKTDVRESLKNSLSFIMPAFLAVFIVRMFIFHNIPTKIFQYNELILTKDKSLILIFAVVTLVAAVSIIIANKELDKEGENFSNVKNKTMLIGAMTGLLTSFIGIGGGFVIIPTLVFLGKLSMKTAVITSLAIIAANAMIGFMGDVVNGIVLNWLFLLSFTTVTMIGVFVGTYLSNRVSSTRIRIVFGYLLVCLTFIIFVKEVILR